MSDVLITICNLLAVGAVSGLTFGIYGAYCDIKKIEVNHNLIMAKINNQYNQLNKLIVDKNKNENINKQI